MSATPRPWKRAGYQPERFAYRITSTDGKLTAEARGAGGPKAEASANAALVVRAVNTFDQAKSFIESFLHAQKLGIEPEATVARIEHAKAVLAQMDGREP